MKPINYISALMKSQISAFAARARGTPGMEFDGSGPSSSWDQHPGFFLISKFHIALKDEIG